MKCDEVVEDDDAMVEEDKENDDKSDTLAALQAELEVGVDRMTESVGAPYFVMICPEGAHFVHQFCISFKF